MGGEEPRYVKNSVWYLKRETGNTCGARARIPSGGMKSFYHSNFSSCGRRAKCAGCGRVRSRNN
jgi:hypothetical protein